MKKAIIVSILAVLFIFNIIGAAIILEDVQVMKFPKITILVNVIEVNSDEILIHHNLQIYNPNSFEMSLQNLQIVTTTPSGEEVARILIDGGSIPGQSNQSYSANDSIIMKGNLSEVLASTVTGIVGINFLGIIKKTIPLEVTVLTSLKDVLSKIVVPTITVRTEFGNITRQEIDLNAEIDITNPNTVDLFIGNIFLNVTTEVGKSVGNFIILGSQIPAESAVTLHGHGTVIIEALNAKKLLINLHAEAGANIAGINKSLPFSSHIEIAIPDLNQFIPADKPLELELKPDLSLARGGIKSNMSLEVINPTKIPLVISDVTVIYYGYKNNQKYYVAEGSLGSGELVPEGTTFFHGEALLLYSKLFNFTGRGFLPEMIFAQLRAKVSVSGVNLSIPVSLGSYIDIQFLRPSQ